WPVGVYARDMARAFSFISGAGRTADGAAAQFFPNSKYVKTTYQKQLQIWRLSSQAERDCVGAMGRGPGTMWTEVRKGLSGRKVAAK
ncbi:hypothetical protein R3P38DRAFT_2575853, partial [Favolaschia claudopus]